MTPADTFPHASGLDRLDHRGTTLQIDHTVPYDAGGATGVGNRPRKPIVIELWHTPFQIDYVPAA